MQVIRQTLDTGWRVREVPPADTPVHNHLPWLPAQVPGHVHLDLMRAGVIPDPFQRMHERDVAWVDEADWVYETTFTVEDPAPANAYLVFHGLDTVAEIVLNGDELGRTDNMYIPHEFSVGGKLTPGDNTLQVTFRSAKRGGLERMAAWNEAGNPTMASHWDGWNARSFVRKAQYMYGWDWGPVLLGCGLWRPVELVTVPVARLTDWKYDVEFTDDGRAVITVAVEVERTSGEDTALTFRASLAGVGFMEGNRFDDVMPPAAVAPVPPGSGRVTVTTTLTVDQPRRWFPNGLNVGTFADGSHPPLYALEMTLSAQEIVDSKSKKIGLRTIELLHEPDSDGQGEGFKFRVNGQDTFIKGANWIPDDSFPSRLRSQSSGTLALMSDTVALGVEQACDAGFNMLRIWGGGFYESEHFYELCDAHGILVWQDFPYACAYYPDTGEYAEAAKIEATAAVKRLRHHPSLALWCGNNENLMMYQGNWHGERPPRYLGEKLYDHVLPAVVQSEDPKTPYWPSSPFGGEDANSPQFGDCHNWDVWHGRGDWTHYPENDARFCSEFGFAASCGLPAWDTVLAPADKHPHSPVVKWHDKTRKGYDTYLGYIGLHFPDPQSLEDLVYYSQLNQAEALKCGVEHYRRRKGHCWGTLFWQFNDCWPTQSWAIVDYLGDPKAAYFAAKKFYAPVLVSLVRDGETVTAHLTNDFLHDVQGTLTLSLETFDGAQMAQTTQEVQVGPNGTQAVATFDLTQAQGREQDVYVYARFQPGAEGVPIDNLMLLTEPKDLRLPTPGLKVIVEDGGAGDFQVTVITQRFAPYVWLRRNDNQLLPGLEDNFFHLRAGEMRTFTVSASDGVETVDDLRGRLVVRTL